MQTEQQAAEIETLQQMIDKLSILGDDSRDRVLKTVLTFFGMGNPSRSELQFDVTGEPRLSTSSRSEGQFSDRENLSPKDFLLAKEPRSDTERVACLAYYLTHYRSMPHFKTENISRLNMEAAQPKLSNPAYAVTNAANAGYLVPAGKGNKQLGAFGERLVQALPERDAVGALRRSHSRRQKRTRKTNASSN